MWTGCLDAMTETSNSKRLLVSKAAEKRKLDKLRWKWENSIEIFLRIRRRGWVIHSTSPGSCPVADFSISGRPNGPLDSTVRELFTLEFIINI
jgi:hypothetical protein